MFSRKNRAVKNYIYILVTRSTETDQQPYIDQWPGQHDQNNNHDQRFSVDFLLIRSWFFLVVVTLSNNGYVVLVCYLIPSSRLFIIYYAPPYEYLLSLPMISLVSVILQNPSKFEFSFLLCPSFAIVWPILNVRIFEFHTPIPNISRMYLIVLYM